MMTLWLILRDRDGNETTVEKDLPGFFFAEETRFNAPCSAERSSPNPRHSS